MFSTFAKKWKRKFYDNFCRNNLNDPKTHGRKSDTFSINHCAKPVFHKMRNP